MAHVLVRGNANCLISLDENAETLYRVCIRSRSIKSNNEYTEKNAAYINKEVLPLLQGYLCKHELISIELGPLKDCLSPFITVWDSDVVKCFKMPNLIPKNTTSTNLDPYTKVHKGDSVIVWEFKPKWLHQNTEYCRNCTLGALRNRQPRCCYAQLLESTETLSILQNFFEAVGLPGPFINAVTDYLKQPDNVLRDIHRAQKKIDNGIPNLAEASRASQASEVLCLSMTLKDLTCFVKWTPNSAVSTTIVDVDQKPNEKWSHWKNTVKALDQCSSRIVHDRSFTTASK